MVSVRGGETACVPVQECYRLTRRGRTSQPLQGRSQLSAAQFLIYYGGRAPQSLASRARHLNINNREDECE